MEFGIYCILWFTSLTFTVLSYYAENNMAFPVIASIGWIILALNSASITYIGFGGMGFDWKTVQAGDPSYGGQMLTPLIYYFWIIGLGFAMMTGSWILLGRNVWDKKIQQR